MSAVPDEFTEGLAQVLKLLRTQRTLPTELEAVLAVAKRIVGSCDAADVTLVVAGEPLTAAATDIIVLQVDVVQYATGQGPCLDAIVGSNVRVDVIDGDLRYERFAPGAVDTAINSVVCPPRSSPQGARPEPSTFTRTYRTPFDADTERVMAPIVSYAADVLSTSPLYAYSLDMVVGLMESLEERAVIAQATGALMARNQWTVAESFDFVRDRALVQGEPLREAATAILSLDPAGPLSDIGPDARPPSPPRPLTGRDDP